MREGLRAESGGSLASWDRDRAGGKSPAPPKAISPTRTDIGPGGAAARPGPGGFVLPPTPWRPWRQRGSPAPRDSPGSPPPPAPGRCGGPRGSPLPGERRPSEAPVSVLLAPPLLGAAVSSETTGFHQGIISSQQGQPQFGSSGFMDNKKACPVKKCSWQPHDASSSGMQSRRNISGRAFRLSLYLLTSGCIVCVDGEECKCTMSQRVPGAGGRSEGSAEEWA